MKADEARLELRSTMAILVIAVTAALAAILGCGTAAADDWPQWRGPRRDGVWRETGIRTSLPDRLEPVWTAPIGSGYSGPTVAGGRVYVADRRTEPEEIERVLCFDAKTGEPLWSHAWPCDYADISYEAGPRCSVLVHADRAYSLGAVGHLHCFDAATGALRWSRDLRSEYEIDMPVWGIAANPIVEGDTLIVPVSGADAYLVAFDLETGAERWRSLSDRGNYAAPIIVEQAGRRVLICWTGDRVVGVAAGSGELLWSHDFRAKRMPLGVATPIVDEKGRLFLTGFYDGCILLQLDPDEPRVTELWRRAGPNEVRTDGLQSIISTPYFEGEHIYGVDSHGELRCLDVEDGDRVWEDLSAVPRARWATIHMVRSGDLTWMFNERGELLIGSLTPEGFTEIDRAALIAPTREQLNQRGGVCWSHPAYAGRRIFVRNDEVLLCADLAATEAGAP